MAKANECHVGLFYENKNSSLWVNANSWVETEYTGMSVFGVFCLFGSCQKSNVPTEI